MASELKLPCPRDAFVPGSKVKALSASKDSGKLSRTPSSIAETARDTIDPEAREDQR